MTLPDRALLAMSDLKMNPLTTPSAGAPLPSPVAAPPRRPVWVPLVLGLDSAVFALLTVVSRSLSGSGLAWAVLVAGAVLVAADMTVGIRVHGGAPGYQRLHPAAGVAFAGASCLPLLLCAAAPGSPDIGLLASLTLLGLPPLVLTSLVPLLVFPGLSEGRRESVIPALLVGALVGAAAAIAATAAPAVILGAADARLTRHAPYLAMGAILLGLGRLMVHHMTARGRLGTPLVHLGIAAAVQVGMLVTATGSDAAVAVNALLGGAVVLFVGLAVADVAAVPFAVPGPAEESAPGPVLVAPALVTMTVAAVVVRVLSARQLWVDEAATAQAARRGSLHAVLEAARGSDPHPPLHLVLTWASRQVLGDGIVALRLPSLLAGTVLVPLLYLAGKELYDRRVGLAAAGIGTVAPALVWFSSEARPPVLAACLATVALVAVLRALRRGWIGDWLVLGAASAALVWTHQLAWVHVAVLFAAAAVTVLRRDGGSRRAGVIGWLAAGAVVAGASVALVAYRSGLGPPPALPPFEYATRAAPGEGSSLFPVIGSGVSALLGLHPPDVTSRLLAVWPLGILGSLLVLGRARSRRGVLLVALSAAPFVALFVAQLLGIPRHPAFALGWAATAVPMVVLLTARAVSVLTGSWPRTRLVAGGVAAVLVVALADQTARVKPVPRYDLHPVVEAVAALARPGDAVVFEPRALRDLLRQEVNDGVSVLSLAAADPAELRPGRRVFVVAAFALSTRQASGDRVIALVKSLSSERRTVLERGRPDLKMWEFS